MTETMARRVIDHLTASHNAWADIAAKDLRIARLEDALRLFVRASSADQVAEARKVADRTLLSA